MYTVYKAILPSNKVYIGYTSMSLEDRKKAHKSLAYSKKRKKYKFANAIRKYGWENVKWYTIATFSNKKEALSFEKYCITEKYKSNINGYNLTNGGESCKFTESSKKNIAKAHGSKWFRVFCKHTKKHIGTWINKKRCAKDLNISDRRISDYLKYKRFNNNYYFIESSTFHSFDYIDYLQSCLPKRGKSFMKKVKVKFSNGKIKYFNSVKYLEKALSIPKGKLKFNIKKLNIEVKYVNY